MKEQLEKLYIEQRLSILDCARTLSRSQTEIRWYLKAFGIRRNTYNSIQGPEERECTKCKIKKNVAEFYYQSYKNNKRKSRQGSWCKSCMSDQVKERQRKYKQQAVDYKGGKCSICGYSRYYGALEFHHLDPKLKDIDLSKFSRHPLSDEGKKELDKCILVCANCHREIHGKLVPDERIELPTREV